MSTAKRAFLYLTRKRSKSILLFIILLVLTTLVMSAVAIGNATEVAAAELRRTLGGYFKLENNVEYSGKQQAITDLLIDRIANIDGIKVSNRMNLEYLLAPGFTLEPGRFAIEGDEKAYLTRFLGNSDSSLHEYFLLRSFELVEGRHIKPDDENKVLISKKVAELNGLSVGDTISAELYFDDGRINKNMTGNSYQWNIVGIFDINTASSGSNEMAAECDMVNNFVFADISSMMRVQTDQNTENAGKYREVSFFVDDPAQLNTILDIAYQMEDIDWESFKLNINDKAYQRAISPLERLGNYIKLFLFIMIGISVVLLSLLLIMWMRDRVHEIGILLSVGIKKSSMIGQHLLEVLILLLFSLAVAFPLSSIISDFAGSAFLENLPQEEVATDKENDYRIRYNPTIDLSEMETTPTIKVSVDMDEFLFVSIYGVCVSLVAVGLSSIFIMRLKPKDILSGIG